MANCEGCGGDVGRNDNSDKLIFHSLCWLSFLKGVLAVNPLLSEQLRSISKAVVDDDNGDNP